MKKLIVFIAALMLTACGQIDQLDAQLTGYSKVCVDGVSYLQFSSGATAQLDSTGKPVTCK